MALKAAPLDTDVFQELLDRSQAELVGVLRERDGIATEKSADRMDEIQYASERDTAIRNADRKSRTFGICIECESPIGPRRLLASPSGGRCITRQDAADQDERGNTEGFGETLVTSV